jgi:hypothetical protein
MKSFFMSLAGYDPKIAMRCPGNNQNKYAAMGAAVFITTLMACFGGYHIAKDIVSNRIAALAFAIFWGSIVFGFEYMMINLFNNSTKARWFIFSMRIAMSICISLLLSTPFVLMLFQATISQGLAEEKKSHIAVIDSTFLVQKSAIDTAMAIRYRSVQEHEKLAMDEALGKSSGTGLEGMGKWWAYKNNALQAAKREDSTYRIQAAAEISKLEVARNNEIVEMESFYAHDFLAQLVALLKLMKDKGIVLFETILIFIVLLLFDLMPIILKTASSLKDESDPYNQLVKIDEQQRLKLAALSLRSDTQNEYNEISSSEASPANSALRTFKGEATGGLLLIKAKYEYLTLVNEEFKDNEVLLQQAAKFLDVLSANLIDRLATANNLPNYSELTLPDQYHAYIADVETLTPHHPFAANQAIVGTVNMLVRPDMPEEQKFQTLFDWVVANIPYDNKHADHSGYRTAIQTFRSKTGICGELAALLITMCRIAGIKADYVSVTKDDKGDDVIHACSGIFINGGFRLADPAYKNPDVLHQIYEVKSDTDILKNFISWNKSVSD